MNPGSPRQFLCSFVLRAMLGAMWLLLPMAIASAKPRSKPLDRETEKIIAEANHLANTQAGEDYLRDCGPYFSPAVGRTFEKVHVPPEKPMLLEVIAVVRADGHIERILAMDNAFSIRFRKELKGTVLPKPPRDRWPLFWNTALVYHLDQKQGQ